MFLLISAYMWQVRFITGNKILRILKSKALAPDLPEDMYFLIKKAVSIRKHLERNRKDKDAKFRLILVESRIHRLGRYVVSKAVVIMAVANRFFGLQGGRCTVEGYLGSFL